MKKFFTLLAATMLSVVGFAAAGPNSGNVQNIPTTADNPFDCSAVIFDQVTYDANWNGNNIDYIGKHDVVSFNINNTKEAAYKITFKYSTILDGVTVDFVIKNASDQEVFKSTINTPSTSGGQNDWTNYVDAESEVTPVLPVGSYKFFIYYGEGTWQGGENPFACNINNIAFIEQAGAAGGVSFDVDLSTVDTSESQGNKTLTYLNDGSDNTPRLDYPSSGDIAKFEIEIPQKSAYKITFNYASPMDKMFMVWTLTDANGNVVYNEYFPLDPTGAPGDFWTIYKDFDGVPQTPVLEAGKYTLRLYYNVTPEGVITPAWYNGSENKNFHSNITRITFTAVAGGDVTPQAGKAITLSAENLDKTTSTNDVFQFTDADGFALGMENRDFNRTPQTWTLTSTGQEYTVKGINFKNEAVGTILIPEGKKVVKLEMGGDSQSTEGNLCYLYKVDVDGANIFTEAIGLSVKDNATIQSSAKYPILPDGTDPLFATIDFATPATKTIAVQFSGFNQENVWFRVTLEGEGGQPAAGSKTIYSWVGGEAGATEVGGTAVASDGQSVNYANDKYYTIRVNGKKADMETNVITITLDEALAEGDEIAITGYRNKDTDANGTLYMLFETGAEIDEGDEVVWNNIHPDIAKEPNTNTYTVSAEAANSKTIKLSRSKASTNVFITEIKITRAGSTGVKAIETVAERPANNFIYNLRGQRVDASYKGIVIMNGKKYFQK